MVVASDWNMTAVLSLLGMTNLLFQNSCKIASGWKSMVSTIAQTAMSMTRALMIMYLRRKEVSNERIQSW